MREGLQRSCLFYVDCQTTYLNISVFQEFQHFNCNFPLNSGQSHHIVILKLFIVEEAYIAFILINCILMFFHACFKWKTIRTSLAL